jgi:hypothetical protein
VIVPNRKNKRKANAFLVFCKTFGFCGCKITKKILNDYILQLGIFRDSCKWCYAYGKFACLGKNSYPIFLKTDAKP